MKQFNYVWRNILKAKTNSLIKIISLTLGLSVAVVLFSKVAFEISYDKFYPDADRLYRIQRLISSQGETAYDGPVINAPVPGAMKEDLQEVADATVITFTSETLCAVFVILLILSCVTLRTWKVANDNPVNSIKAE